MDKNPDFNLSSLALSLICWLGELGFTTSPSLRWTNPDFCTVCALPLPKEGIIFSPLETKASSAGKLPLPWAWVVGSSSSSSSSSL